MESFFTAANLLNLITLTGLEVVLGIDNVIFIALLVQHLHTADRNKARFIGLSLALILRILLLLCASWIIGLTNPLFTLFTFPFSGRSILLIAGGLFLVIKSILELIELFKGEHHDKEEHPRQAEKKRFRSVIIQIVFIDLVLSFDSIITAVGMSNNIPVIVIAIVIAIILMLVSAKPIGDFIYRNPSIKVIALAFILLVGVFLVSGGFDIEMPKGYLYFSMFFALAIETLNIMLQKKNPAHSRAAQEAPFASLKE